MFEKRNEKISGSIGSRNKLITLVGLQIQSLIKRQWTVEQVWWNNQKLGKAMSWNCSAWYWLDYWLCCA